MPFNSREYQWSDVTVITGGKDLTKIRGVKYTEKIEREAVFAKGKHAHSIQDGNVMVEGEIAVLQSDYEKMVKEGNGTVLSLNVDTEVSYGNPPDTTTTDRIVGMRFTEAPKEFKQGDKFQEITLPFVALAVQNQV